jgi:hypothetical protein
MPASLKRIRDGGGTVFLHTCEACGADASFGIGVSMRLALNKLAAGDVVGAKRHLGQWYCRGHRPAAGDAGA